MPLDVMRNDYDVFMSIVRCIESDDTIHIISKEEYDMLSEKELNALKEIYIYLTEDIESDKDVIRCFAFWIYMTNIGLDYEIDKGFNEYDLEYEDILYYSHIKTRILYYIINSNQDRLVLRTMKYNLFNEICMPS